MIANARMYSVNAAAKAAWRELLARVMRRASASWEFIDCDAPALLRKGSARHADIVKRANIKVE